MRWADGVAALQLSPAETLLAGLLAAVLVLLVWLLVRSHAGGRRLRTQLGDELAELIESMSAAKLVRMASSQTLIPCFRFDDAQLARLMSGEGRDATSAGLHAAILAAGRAAGEAP